MLKPTKVQFGYTPNANRATNVPVTIETADGQKVATVNERKAPSITAPLSPWESMVTITNTETDGYVVVDAIRFVPKD